MTLVEVHWTDAHASTADTSLKKALKDTGTKTITVGILVCETDAGLTIAMDAWPESPKRFKVTTFIGWGMIDHYYVWE